MYAVERDRFPIVLKGADLGPWVNHPDVTLDQIYLYKHVGGAWVPIRFQIDKRRETNLNHNLSYPEYLALDAQTRALLTDICANTYFPPPALNCTNPNGPDWDEVTQPGQVRHCSSYLTAWNSNQLYPSDEVVFMARDVLDAERDCPVDWLDPGGAPGLQNDRLEIQIVDNGDVYWIYAFRWTTTPPSQFVAGGSAPSFVPNPSCTPCSDPSRNQQNLCGEVTSSGAGSLTGYKVNLKANWAIDRLQVEPNPTTPPTNLVALFRFEVGNIEDETTWSCHQNARKHSYTDSSKKVRWIRSIQGAQSGFATVRADKAYDTLYETEIELRVHHLPTAQPLSVVERHTELTVPSGINDTPFSAVWNDDGAEPDTHFDRMSKGSGHPNPPAATVPYDAWSQMIDNQHGSVATYMIDDPMRGGIPADTKRYVYDDTVSLHGNFGRSWEGVSCTQDGFDNDGGCGSGDPDSSSLRYRRTWIRSFTTTNPGNELLPGAVEADENASAARAPVSTAITALQYPTTGGCGGGGPCIPTLQISNTGEGETDLNNSPSASPVGCSGPNIAAYGVTRQIAGGPEREIGVVKPGVTLRDRTTRPGQVHTYRSYAIAKDGTQSAKTAPVSTTPSDTQAPPAPSITATGASYSATIDFDACTGLGVSGANVYVSTVNGGPYNKVNAVPIGVIGTSSYVVSGLQNNVTYYVVAKLIDHAGNLSPYSAQVAVTPQAP